MMPRMVQAHLKLATFPCRLSLVTVPQALDTPLTQHELLDRIDGATGGRPNNWLVRSIMDRS
ncbi:MAG: hypothetical protein KatS3mg111_2800 [Pirellulaceae bacterium]|nr:MAG: hypothetical protein KatS3mg111_2800 [Pirellulaceae bacterium]